MYIVFLLTFHIQIVTQTTSASRLQRRCELENTRNAWARFCKEHDDNEVEIDVEDYESRSPSRDSEYSESRGWTQKSSEDDEDEEDSKKDGVKKFKGSTAKNVQKKRPRRRCPLKGCKADVIDIPRHLREVHDWSKEMARKATSSYGMRKSFEPKPVKNNKSESSEGKKIYTDYHRHRACPIQGCKSVVKRLSNHIRQVHRDIPVGSPFYKKILREARSVKTWKPSEQVKRFRTEEETKIKKCSLAESEDEVEVQTNNTEPSEEEQAIMESAEEAYSSNVEDEINVVSSFRSWLQSADGGRKDKKLSKQHASQLFRILQIIDPSLQFESLFNKTLVRDTFLKQAEAKYTADTVKAYLLSLRHFCSYVVAEKPESVAVDLALVQQIQEKARLWSMSYRKDSKRRYLEKMDNDLSNLVTPEMVNEYERSEAARSAVNLLEQLSGAHSLQVNQSMYTLVRDFILLEITIANAHRSGVLANMTLEEYKAAKRVDDSMVISVKDHKTADTHGPARVVLSLSLFSYLRLYVSEMRSQMEDSTSEEYGSNKRSVFLSWNGSKLESGQISTAINAAWRKGGMEGHVTSTIFRKSAVTKVHTRHKGMKSDLADLMAHKEGTAERFYRLKKKEEACVQAASSLPTIMRSAEPKKGVEDTLPTATTSHDVPLEADDRNNKERMLWDEEQVATLKDVFFTEIESKSITMAEVREKIQEHPVLCCRDPRKVYDKIRSEWRFNDKSNSQPSDIDDDKPSAEQPPKSPELPKESDSLADKMSRFFSNEESSVSMVPPSNSSYVSRNIFSDDHRKYLLKVCGGMVKSGVISQTAVKDMLGKEEEGKAMLHEFKLKQIINRLKYERRLNQKK